MTGTAAVIGQEGERGSCRGEKLYTVHYAPPGETVAALIWHHGYGEHVGRMKWVFSQFTAAGIAVHAYDAHGHGRSGSLRPKDRAYIHSYTYMVDDLDAFVGEVVAQYPPGTPIFHGAQSMGCLITLHSVLRKQSRIHGLVLCSALINVVYTPILRVQAKLGNVLATVVPRVRCVPAINPDDMSPDPAVVKDYREDPLNFVGKVRARTGNELLKAMRDMDRRKAEVAVPMVAIHGTADHTTSLAAVKALLKESASKDVTLKEYPGGYHELLHGPEKEDAVRFLTDWILSHSRRAPTPQANGESQMPAGAVTETKL